MCETPEVVGPGQCPPPYASQLCRGPDNTPAAIAQIEGGNGQAQGDGQFREDRRQRQPECGSRRQWPVRGIGGALAGRAGAPPGCAPAQPQHPAHGPHRRGCRVPGLEPTHDCRVRRHRAAPGGAGRQRSRPAAPHRPGGVRPALPGTAGECLSQGTPAGTDGAEPERPDRPAAGRTPRPRPAHRPPARLDPRRTPARHHPAGHLRQPGLPRQQPADRHPGLAQGARLHPLRRPGPALVLPRRRQGTGNRPRRSPRA